MSPLPAAPVLARLALKFLISKGPALMRQFSASVKDLKRLMPQDAELQALPDDAAAIEQFAVATHAALDESAAITARLRARAAAEDDGA